MEVPAKVAMLAAIKEVALSLPRLPLHRCKPFCPACPRE
jgi:hypothetical protein